MEDIVSVSCVRLGVKSPVFEDGGRLPLQYTFDGADISPSPIG